MPHVLLSTPTGPVDYHYNILTPTSPSSPSINPSLPCILFVHSQFYAQETFEAQFCDPQLRKSFNLIGIDMRSFGSTRGPVAKDVYTPEVAADDLYRFIKAKDLPPVHVFALAIGCCVAMELAMSHPDVVLSLTLCSPLPPTEPEDVATGRLEIFGLWEKSFQHESSAPPGAPLVVDQMMLDDLVQGSQQLCFSNKANRLTEAITKSSASQAADSWAGTPEKLAICYVVSIAWFLERKVFTLQDLAKLKCPIRIIHCDEDIAYPFEDAEALKTQLQEAGVEDVDLSQISGPHYGNVVNPHDANRIIYEFVSALTPGGPGKQYVTEEERVTTPYTERLAEFGYGLEDDSDSEYL